MHLRLQMFNAIWTYIYYSVLTIVSCNQFNRSM
nr:MAG TPA: hypothetical protein [Caudoviricetes sp.]